MISCSNREVKNGTSGGNEGAGVHDEVLSVTFECSDELWVYISLKTGKVVGHSEFNNHSEDAQWKNRLDWDIAFCGDRMRTNSGTSGNGKGGIISVIEPFDQVCKVPDKVFYEDEFLKFPELRP